MELESPNKEKEDSVEASGNSYEQDELDVDVELDISPHEVTKYLQRISKFCFNVVWLISERKFRLLCLSDPRPQSINFIQIKSAFLGIKCSELLCKSYKTKRAFFSALWFLGIPEQSFRHCDSQSVSRHS